MPNPILEALKYTGLQYKCEIIQSKQLKQSRINNIPTTELTEYGEDR